MIRTEFLDVSLFLRDKEILRLFHAVKAAGGVIRFVGGAVRDALAGLKNFEIDLATDLSPDELVEACHECGLKTTPIGLKSSTTGVVVGDKVYEVSSLRKNVKKSDRWEYTDDWNADASLRDLTVNAVYADENGNVFDYYNGISDLEKGIIRFIGSPDDRIYENPIRIMRFFRFYALFGKGEPDAKSLKACISHKDLLKEVSIEQVRDELFKIFAMPNLVSALKIMFEHDILSYILPPSGNISLLENLTTAVSQSNQLPDSLRRLFILYTPTVELADSLAMRLHLSKIQKKRLVNWAMFELDSHLLNDDTYFNRQIFEHGKEFCKDKILFLRTEEKISVDTCVELLHKVDSCIIPEFPLTGSDLITLGIADSRKIGDCLEKVKSFWIKNNFAPDKQELCNQAVKIIKNQAV